MQVVAAMQLVLHHCPATVESQKQLATLALVCTAVRQMLQAAPAASTDIRVSDLHISQLADFARWLTVYAGMVNSIRIQLQSDSKASLGCDDSSTYTAVAEQLLLFSLQESTSAFKSSLRLQSFSSNFINSAAVLRALAGTCVKELTLHGLPTATDAEQQTQHVAKPAFTDALAGLVSLRSLSLGTECEYSGDLAMPYAPALAKLTALKRLEIQYASLPPEAAAHLPCSLEYLGTSLDTPGPVDLSHLSRLRRLHLEVYTELTEECVLPSSITYLDLCGEGHVGCLDLSVLSGLQGLVIGNIIDVSELLLPSCSALTHLTSLELIKVQLSSVAMLGPIWHRMPELLSLQVDLLGSVDGGELSSICRGVGRAVGLKYLAVQGESLEGQDSVETVDVCKHLTGLSQLTSLVIEDITCMSSYDPMHLTVLTALQSLSLHNCGPVVDDAVATAVGCRLTRLKELQLDGCGLSSVASLPALALLTGLHLLSLSNNSTFACTDAALMMLSTLSKLLWLHIDKDDLTEEGIQQFKAAVPDMTLGL